MLRGKVFKMAILGLTMGLLSAGISSVYARTDDAKVLDGVGRGTEISQIISKYDLSLAWSGDRSSTYTTKDKNLVIITFRYPDGKNCVSGILIKGPEYKTDKGVRVGMGIEDVVLGYGPLYSPAELPLDQTKTFGMYNANDYDGPYQGYSFIEYDSAINEGIEFVIDKATQKIVLIRYESDRHGADPVSIFVKNSNVLPMRVYVPQQ